MHVATMRLIESGCQVGGISPACGVSPDPRLIHHDGLIPDDVNTLNKLCALSDDRFQELLDNGTIHPDMPRNYTPATPMALIN